MQETIPGLPPWLEPHRDHLQRMIERRQSPQALLIHGLPGTGRRQLALWLASELLRIPFARLARLAPAAPGDSLADSVHPDLMIVQPPPDKDSISVDQVRDLAGFLQLRSHQGGERVALVWPADSMTHSAANSLLKALEEPPAGSSIMLIAAAPRALPPTILSRCHRLRLTRPARAVALNWLSTQGTEENWELMLEFAGGAPLEALALHRRGFQAQMKRYARDMKQLGTREDTPVAVARRWVDVDAELSLRWLYWQTARSIVKAATGPAAVSPRKPGNGHLQNAPKHLTMRRLQERARAIEELYRNRSGAMNQELQLSSILQGWYGDAANGDGS